MYAENLLTLSGDNPNSPELIPPYDTTQLRKQLLFAAGDKLQAMALGDSGIAGVTKDNLLRLTPEKLLKKSAGNVVNYAVDLLRGVGSLDQSTLVSAENLVIDNLHTMVAEHLKAKAFGVDEYQLVWESDAGQLKLGSQFGYLEDIIRRSIDDTNQVPMFELPRNQENLNFISRLTAAQSLHISHGIQYSGLEFSPSPLLSIDGEEELLAQIRSSELAPLLASNDRETHLDDAKYAHLPVKVKAVITNHWKRSRGYRLGDSLLDYASDGKVTQYWLPRQDLAVYRQLALDLLHADPSNTSLAERLDKIASKDVDALTDVDIMQLSGAFSPVQKDMFITFIKSRQDYPGENKGEIRQFVEYELKQLTAERLLPITYRLAQDILAGKDDEYLLAAAGRLYSGIEDLQLVLLKYLREQARLNIADVKLEAKLKQGAQINYKEFLKLDYAARESYKVKLGYAQYVSGCGVGGKDTNKVSFSFSRGNSTAAAFSPFRAFRVTGASIFPSAEKPDHVDCPSGSCPGFYVKNGDVSTYEHRCPVCGTDIPGCD